MKIGIFDSGLGGLLLTEAVRAALPEYDYVYLGDTARVPYGDRSQDVIFQFTKAAVDHLFRVEDCQLIILACNTASSEALRRIQQEYLPSTFPDRRVLGVIIPTVESVTGDGPVGVLATRSTVRSMAFPRELAKLRPELTLMQQAAPLLVHLIENNALQWAGPIIEYYVAPLRAAGITQLILGCTHYGLAYNELQAALPSVDILRQESVLPLKLRDYLRRHPELETKLSRGSSCRYLVTDLPAEGPTWQTAAPELITLPL